jgi:hypothetical protein
MEISYEKTHEILSSLQFAFVSSLAQAYDCSSVSGWDGSTV